MIPLPTGLPIKALVLLATLGAAALGGWTIRGWKEDSTRLDAVQRTIAQERQRAREDAEILEEGFALVREAHTRFVTIEKEVPRVATPDCTDLGPDFGRVFNAAITAANE